MHVPDVHLKTFLADAGLVSRKAFDDASHEAASTGRTVPDILLAKSDIGEDDLRRTYAHALGIPFVSIPQGEIPFEVLSLIPEPLSREHSLIAYARNGNDVEVALLDTDDLEAIGFLRAAAQIRILPRLTDQSSIQTALRMYQKMLYRTFGDSIGRAAQALDSSEDPTETTAAQLVDLLFSHASLSQATDIHLEPHEDVLQVRYRIGGRMRDAFALPGATAGAIAKHIKSLGKMSDDSSQPQEGRIVLRRDHDDDLSLRVSTLPTPHGERIAIRVLRKHVSGFTLESLGFHGAGLEKVHEALRHEAGLILVTGPAHSGKTTALYTLIDTIRRPDIAISTIEDPIEYRLRGINQTQVNASTGFSYARALRGIARQDQDVVMVADLKDRETAMLALHAASSGKLVLAGIEADSAAEAINTMLRLDVDPKLFASALNAVIAVRVLPRISGEAQERELSRDETSALERVIDPGMLLRSLKEEDVVARTITWRTLRFNDATVDGQGEKLVGIQEVLSASATIRDLIRAEAPAEEIFKRARMEGLLTLAEDAAFKAVLGQIAISDVVAAIGE